MPMTAPVVPEVERTQSVDEAKAWLLWDEPGELRVAKEWDGEWYGGKVIEVWNENLRSDDERVPLDEIFFRVRYDDGDQEDLLRDELKEILLGEGHPLYKKETNKTSTGTQRVTTVKRGRMAAADMHPLHARDTNTGDDPANTSRKKKRQRVEKENADVTAGVISRGLQSMGEPGPAGTIGRVHIQRFMCHDNFCIDFGPNVNFVSGENGSGKSAILTALLVCMGVSAKTTRRSDRLDDMVKHGQDSAWVQVVLWNTGDDAYKPNVYGDRIVIEKRIGKSKSHELKDFTGRKQDSGKAAVQSVLDHFSIDVNNPCTVLGQDHSREFLGGGANDTAKFKFFMEGTLMQSVEDNLCVAKEHVKSMGDHLAAHKEELLKLERQKEEVEEKLENAQHQVSMKAEELELQKLAAWAGVKELEGKVALAADIIENRVPQKIARQGAKAAEATSRVEAAQQAHQLNEAEVISMQSEMARFGEEQGDMQNKLRDAQRTERDAADYLRGIQEEEEEAEATRVRVEGEIRRAQEEYEANIQGGEGGGHADRVAERLAEVDRARAAKEAAEAEYDEAKQRKVEAERQVQTARAVVTQAEGEIRLRTQAVEQARRGAVDEGDYARSFGPGGTNFLDLYLREVERAFQQGKFRRRPIGPLGRHIKVSDPKWAIPVEVCLFNLLSQFIVDNIDDRAVLQQCFLAASRAASGSRQNYQFQCYVKRYQDAVYDVSRNRPPHDVTTILDVIRCDVPTVVNLLIDQARIESIAIVLDDMDEARRVGYRTPGVKSCYMGDGTQLVRRKNSEAMWSLPSGHYLKGNPPRIQPAQANLANEIAYAENALAEARGSLQHAQHGLEEAAAASRQVIGENKALFHQTVKPLVNAFGLAESQLKDAVTDQTQATQAMEQVMGGSHLTATLQQANAKLAEMAEKKPEAEEILREAQAVRAIEEGALHTARAAVERFQETSGGMLEGELLLKEKTEKEEQIVEQRAKASIICPEEDLKKLVHYPEGHARWAEPVVDSRGQEVELTGKVDQALRRKKRDLEKSRKVAGDVHQLTIDLEERATVVRKMMKKIHRVEENHESLQDFLHRRIVLLRKTSNQIGQSISHTFNAYLSRRGHSGNIKVDPDEGKVKLNVTMNGHEGQKVKDTKSMSGGEKSYTTLSFTLALGNETDAPFRAMDEFDVFMDNVNRKVSLITLMEYAETHSDSQFIFLTPQDISEVDPTKYPPGFMRVHGIQPAR